MMPLELQTGDIPDKAGMLERHHAYERESLRPIHHC
jgi:hypothetical protein